MSDIKYLFCNMDDSILSVYKIFDKASNYNLPSGISLVTNNEGILVGTVTEGDIRKGILNHNNIDLKVKDVIQSNPITFKDNISISEIINQLPNELSIRKRKSNKFLGKIILVNDLNQPTRVLDYHQLWEQRVATHRHIVILGLGYVGLTMAAVMADAGFNVTGIEVDDEKIKSLNNGISYIHEQGLEELLNEQLNKNLHISKEIPDDGDVFIISVGTPVVLDSDGIKRPIMKYLEDACDKISLKLKRGHLVILRSTVPIGTCRDFVKKRLEESTKLICGIDFHLSFAPERTAEGKALRELRTLPQIIGGYNNDSLESTAAIFRDITPTVVKVDSLEAAEMAKLINNSFRDYVFAYANQMAQIASKFNINVVEIIKAANEGYPRDTVPLPSPGVGGPCLTKDPYIFSSIAEKFNFDSGLFINGRKINESMHEHVFNQVMNQLNLIGKEISQCKILVCGLAFKGNPETGDIRNSSAIEIAQLFKDKAHSVYAYDPIAKVNEIKDYNLLVTSIPEGFTDKDVVLFLNNHKSFEKINVFDMVRSMNPNAIIYDGWNLFRSGEIISTKPCVYMGLSYSKSSIK